MTKESLLERMLTESKRTKHPSPFKKEDLPSFDGPWFDIGRRAVEVLTDQNEIREFMRQYVEYLQKNYSLSMDAAEKSAKSGVGYCTGYTEDTQANRWFDALPDISHPVTGRERPFRGGENVKCFYLIGNTHDQEIRTYLSNAFSCDLPVFRCDVLDKSPIKGKDNTSYFAIRIKPKGANGSEAYLLLAGYIEGLKIRMKMDLGKSCELNLEKLSDK